ncbi:hypothetical protein TSEDIMI_370002 [Tenacibaculum sediminilitoris]|uniref:RHS repeat domain-containing protein n=1 Tax=Tenacibaculum sediminilitoris TaxID=1820334 RepID=UPI003895141D
MGNILTLTRKGHLNADATSFGVMDNLSYTYDNGNKLLKVTDAGNKTYGFKDGTNTNNDFEYDINGNMVVNRNKGITNIIYNHLNLPTQVTINGNNISFIYDAKGEKQKKVLANKTVEYAGNFVYENGALKQFSHPEGYVKNDNGTFNYVYSYTDHLGSIRLSYSDLNNDGVIQASSEILDERNTYPFGLEHKGYNSNVIGAENDYQTYLGQEMNKEFGLNWLTFRYRNYMPELGRFFGVDPVSSEYMSISTFQFAHNSPIWKVELEGLEGGTTNKKGRGDTTNHDPIKVINQNQRPQTKEGFIGGGLGKMIVVQETTKEVAKEVVKKPSLISKVASGASTALTTVIALMTPTEAHAPTKQPDFLEGAQPLSEDDFISSDNQTDNNDDAITLFRGVSSENMEQYGEALIGMAIPNAYRSGKNNQPHSSEENHSFGFNNTVWTSWSSNKEVAKNFALGDNGNRNGVILTKKFKKSQVDFNYWSYKPEEMEWLVRGVVTGADVETTNPQKK